MAGIAKDGSTPQERHEERKGWQTLARKDDNSHGYREVRMSPTGIVVVEDTLLDGSIRHTRVAPNGRHAQTIADSPRKAWLAARKLVV